MTRDYPDLEGRAASENGMRSRLRSPQPIAGAVLALVLAMAVGSFGCGDDNQTTTTPTTPTSPTTSTLSTKLTVNGSVSRSFTASKAGSVTVTLTSAGAAGTVVGLGIGVPSTGIARCTLSSATTTAAGSQPQIVANVDAGAYCVAVYDVGNLRDEITFELTVVFP